MWCVVCIFVARRSASMVGEFMEFILFCELDVNSLWSVFMWKILVFFLLLSMVPFFSIIIFELRVIYLSILISGSETVGRN